MKSRGNSKPAELHKCRRCGAARRDHAGDKCVSPPRAGKEGWRAVFASASYPGRVMCTMNVEQVTWVLGVIKGAMAGREPNATGAAALRILEAARKRAKDTAEKREIRRDVERSEMLFARPHYVGYTERARDVLKAIIRANSMPDHSTGCAIWSGTRTHHGYGAVAVGRRAGLGNGRRVAVEKLAHVVARALATGEAVSGDRLKNTCGNRGCVTVDHWDAVDVFGMKDLLADGEACDV